MSSFDSDSITATSIYATTIHKDENLLLDNITLLTAQITEAKHVFIFFPEYKDAFWCNYDSPNEDLKIQLCAFQQIGASHKGVFGYSDLDSNLEAKHLSLIRDGDINSFIKLPLRDDNNTYVGVFGLLFEADNKTLTQKELQSIWILYEEILLIGGLLVKKYKADYKLRLAQEKTSRMEQFIHMVSHDLKEPLNNLIAISDIMSMEVKAGNTDSIKDYLELMKTKALVSKDMISGLLKYAKESITAVPRTLTDSQKIITEIVEFFKKQCPVIIEFEKPAPTFVTEKILFERVAFNLITNAINYNDKSRCIIKVSTDEHKDHYHFKFKDNGPGIAPHMHNEVFKLWQRGAQNEHTEGSGIGLAAVKKIIDDKGGKIWIDEVYDQGAQFEFTWPKA